MGFPFFSPLYLENATVKIRCGNLWPEHNIKDILSLQMSKPNFPIGLDSLKASLEFTDFVAGQSFEIGKEILITTIPLNHPDGATGYRISHLGKSICYITDNEHTLGSLNLGLVDFLRDTDLLIYDCTYDDANFFEFKGWGHSTWQEGARLTRAANVKKFAIFHHDPASTDDILNRVASEAEILLPNSFVATEGLSISL